ncbi:unnamed protein product, partial [marine sediment metagenome]
MNYHVADNAAGQDVGAAFTTGVPMTRSDIIEISSRAAINMHDEYFYHASPDHFWIQWRFTELQRMISGIQLGDQILEVGSGNGVMQGMFEKALGVPVHGCDLNLEALQQTGPTQGNVYLYDVIERCPEWENWFHTVLLLDVLEHIEYAIEFLTAIRFHIKPGG